MKHELKVLTSRMAKEPAIKVPPVCLTSCPHSSDEIIVGKGAIHMEAAAAAEARLGACSCFIFVGRAWS
jgi:hypothetical protein